MAPGGESFYTGWQRLLVQETLPGYIPTSDMAQNVATACKMKSRPETTSLGQTATVTAKPRKSDKERWFG